MKKYLLLALLPLLYACSDSPTHRRGINYDEVFSKDTQGLDILTGQFSHNIDRIWGVNELLVASRKDYVKYTDSFYTRSHVSFDEGTIIVETQQDLNRLHNAIVHTLLMGYDAKGIDLFASGDVPISTRPFLLGQVVDNNGQQIANQVIASNFATYLIQNKLQTRRLQNGNTVQFVVISMIANHVEVRAQKYIPLVRKAAERYGIDESLILGIMQTESSFNPYAISYANAIGLMQVVPSTAGRDVFAMKGKGGQPSARYLYDPANNIDAGVAYLWILQNQYLDGITNPTSKRFLLTTVVQVQYYVYSMRIKMRRSIRSTRCILNKYIVS